MLKKGICRCKTLDLLQLGKMFGSEIKSAFNGRSNRPNVSVRHIDHGHGYHVSEVFFRLGNDGQSGILSIYLAVPNPFKEKSNEYLYKMFWNGRPASVAVRLEG